MLNKIAPYILAIALFIFGLSLGFFAGKKLNLDIPMPREQAPSPSPQLSLYSSQTAFFKGQILSINGKEIHVKNLNNNIEGDIKLSDQLVISKGNSQPTSDLKAIELNKDVLINLLMLNGEYKATSVQYISAAPSLPPVSKTTTSTPSKKHIS